MFAGLLAATSGLLSVTVRDLLSDMGVEVTAGSPWVGTRTGDRLSPGTAVLVNQSIARHYRGGRPRNYMPFGTGTDIMSTGLWTGGFVSAVDTAFNAFVNALIGTFGTMTITGHVNVSYYGPPNRLVTSSTGRVRTVSSIRATPIVDPITANAASATIGSQRRRNRDA